MCPLCFCTSLQNITLTYINRLCIMSIDFDSAALQTQHDEEEYDQEDYAREQEVTYKTHRCCTVKLLG